MRKLVFTAAALAVFTAPAAAEHLYSNGQPPHGLQQYGVEPQSGYPAPSDARAVDPRRHNYGRDRRDPRTGLDRPYGGQGVPYRTPPQGWPNPPTRGGIPERRAAAGSGRGALVAPARLAYCRPVGEIGDQTAGRMKEKSHGS